MMPSRTSNDCRKGRERRTNHKRAGGKLLAHYYTLGRYDFVGIVDMPSNEALMKVIMELGKWGTVSTETVTALLPEDVYKVAMEM
jgi:uncharacterized protein with GYD domain